MTKKEKSIEAQLMIYTRSTLFDYTWIYGHRDTQFRKELEGVFNEWIDNKLLDKISQKVTFFSTFKKHFILLVAKPSDRVDRVKRIIFDRAILLWKHDTQLNYNDLAKLSSTLESQAEEVYTNLPSDVTNYETDYWQGTITLKDKNLTQGEKIVKAFFSPPLSWNDVKQKKLVVEMPSSIEFKGIAEILGDYSLENSITICHGVPIEKRFPKDESCIVSGNSANSEEIAVYDRNLNLYCIGAIKEVLASDYETSTNENLQKIQVKEKIDREETEPEKNKDSSGIFNEIAEKIKSLDSKQRNTIFRRFQEIAQQKFSNTQKKQVLKLITEIFYLLNPVEILVSVEIHILWQNLFCEIMLLQDKESDEIKKSWVQRISLLKPITIATVSELEIDSWQETFNEKCNELKKALIENNS